MIVAVAVADDRGGCGWYCEFFWGSRIYYFIVVVIIFYCDIYIICCVKIDPLLQHECR